MLVKLTIGFDDFLLPDDKGLSTLVRALSRARVIEIGGDNRHKGGGIKTYGFARVKTEYLPNMRLSPARRDRSDPKVEYIEPEVLPSEAPRQIAGAARRQIAGASRRMLPGGEGQS